MSRRTHRSALLVVMLMVAALVGGALTSRGAPVAQASRPSPQPPLLDQLRAATGGQLVASTARETGTYNFVRARGVAVLSADNAAASAETRAFSFLASYGSLMGIKSPSSELRVADVSRDAIGMTHVRLKQVYGGLPVYGGEVLVHMNGRGIKAFNGTFVPDIAVGAQASISAAAASQHARNAVAKAAPGVALAVARTGLYVYRTGLLEGFFGRNVLAYGVEVIGANLREAVWIDAHSGAALNRVSLVHTDLNRVVYTPTYNPDNPNLFVARREGDPPSLLTPVNNLYDFSGQIYDLFHNAFGRDSYDGAGATMRTVYLVNQQCPNAYWNGSTTNYCPGFDLDDVVAHEWGHAYTEHTHGLVYQYQSGALNEAYSDMWGETLDLYNNRDGIGGSNNSQPYPNGQRWLVGEDLGQPVQELLLRDMWDPDRLGSPGKVSSPNYYCGTDDGGGVHTNSGVPNHAFAMLCDGKTYNGQTVVQIGVVKATHIYYRAMTVYQAPTTNFAAHADALEASCDDLTGVAGLKDFRTGQPTGDVVTAGDCQQVAKAMLAVEMRDPPQQCMYQPILDPNAPAICDNAQILFNEDWESGNDGWTHNSVAGATGDAWPNYNWTVTNDIPAGHTGAAAFAVNAKVGTCAPGGDISGHFTIDSPVITIATADTPMLRFDHWVATEAGFDGGNLKISVNGGAFALVSDEAYVCASRGCTD